METLKGTLRAKRYSGKGFWTVASLEPAGAARGECGALVTVVGPLVGVEVGDSIEIEGEWVDDPRWGRQFKFRASRTLTPSDHEGVVAWMAGRLPGVGRARAIEIVRAIGPEQIWHVLEHEPLRLCGVSGITPERAQAIRAAYLQQRAGRDTLVFLQRWGLTDWQCGQIVARYGSESERVLRDNPYRLIEIDGFGFKRTDEIAQRLGVPLDHIERARAAALHMLDVARALGHVFVPLASLAKRCLADLEVPAGRVREAVAVLLEERKVIVEGDNVYLPALHAAELHVASRLAALRAWREAA
jgi:exodeoxyribonuclease V alpha subunit